MSTQFLPVPPALHAQIVPARGFAAAGPAVSPDQQVEFSASGSRNSRHRRS